MIDRINDAETFDDVVRIRTEIYEAMVRGDNHLEDVLVGLYKEETHFLYELLQNADDVVATEIDIKLTEKELIFWHNGIKNFDLKDVVAITGIGAGTKREDENKIGKFGIGFKSVFAVTESPRIYSGDFCFEIHHFTVPSRIERPADCRENGTTFILPFNHREKLPEDTYDGIEQALYKMDSNAFMFLYNIRNVSWSSENKKGSLIKEVIQHNGYQHLAVMTNEDDVLNEYLIFSAPLTKSSKLSVSIAFKIYGVEGTSEIIPIHNSKLSVYFFTETETYLNFIVNGPFITSSTRESVDGLKQHNQQVLNEIASLYRKSLQALKTAGFLNESFLEMLPIERTNCNSSFIYERLYRETYNALRCDNILPSASAKFTNSIDAILARGIELTRLLSQQSDIELLFKRKTWLSTQITSDRLPKLRSHLVNDHKVPEVTYPAFCRSITSEFMKRKGDKWLVRFYTESGSRYDKEVRQILCTKPIIRTASGKMVVPFVDDKPVVFFPSPSISHDKIIKSSLLADEEARIFLSELGLGTIDAIDELRTNILPKFLNTNDTSLRLKYFDAFCTTYKNAHTDSERTELIELLEDSKIVLFVDAKNNLETWDVGRKGYLKSQALETIYNGCEKVLFVSPRILNIRKDKRNIQDLLIRLGVDTSLARSKISDLDYEKKRQLRAGASYKYETVEDYNIHCLDFILENINTDRSKALFLLLAEQNEDFFAGSYSWSYYQSRQSKRIVAHFIDTLNERAWISTDNNEFEKPSELKKGEIIKKFEMQPNSPILKYLDFIPEAIDLLPDNLRKKLEIIKDIPIEILIELKEKHESAKEVSFEEQIIEEEPGLNHTPINEVVPPVRDIELSNILSDNGEGEDTDNRQSRTPDYVIKKGLIIKTTDNKRKTVGDWGEDKVIDNIQRKYETDGYAIINVNDGFVGSKDTNSIKLVNKNIIQGNNCGYDFELYENGELVEYIEVKSKIRKDPELFSISGKQWDMAKALYSINKGDLYVIYLVSSAGTADAKIDKYRNTYKLWQDGRLFADPVNIEL